MSNNSNLHTSKKNKNDEYYTYYEDVVKGLEPYKEYLKGKRVLCPCDTDESNFVKYLKELGCDVIAYHKENGSEWFKPDDYDVCVTNPPFSKIKDFYNTYKDKPLIFVCTFNHLCYKDLFIDFMEGRLNIGQSNQSMYFNAQGEHKSVSLCMFVSNLNIVENNPHLELCKENKGVYLDGTNILNVDKSCDIPDNYYGTIAVPISYICKHNADDFDIVAIANTNSKGNKYDILTPYVNGKQKFKRLLIRRRHKTQ